MTLDIHNDDPETMKVLQAELLTDFYSVSFVWNCNPCITLHQ